MSSIQQEYNHSSKTAIAPVTVSSLQQQQVHRKALQTLPRQDNSHIVISHAVIDSTALVTTYTWKLLEIE